MNDRYPYTPDMPVSAKYYARLVERVRTILKDLHIYIQWRENAILCRINHYISPGRTDIDYAQTDKYCNIIFQALRAEIDTAVERSRRARARAAARRALREAAKNPQQLPDNSANSDNTDNSDRSDRPDRSALSDNITKSIEAKNERPRSNFDPGVPVIVKPRFNLKLR